MGSGAWRCWLWLSAVIRLANGYDAQQYLEAFPRFARAFGGGAIDHGTAHFYEGFSGVAWWLPPGAAPSTSS
jgi:hypothetical protein